MKQIDCKIIRSMICIVRSLENLLIAHVVPLDSKF
jgi:hypothetical protein